MNLHMCIHICIHNVYTYMYTDTREFGGCPDPTAEQLAQVRKCKIYILK